MSLLEESKAITDELEQHKELHDKIDAIVNAKFFDLMSKNVKESDAVVFEGEAAFDLSPEHDQLWMDTIQPCS